MGRCWGERLETHNVQRGGVPNRSNAVIGAGDAGALASEKKAREAFILREYFSSKSRLKTVVRLSSCARTAIANVVNARSLKPPSVPPPPSPPFHAHPSPRREGTRKTPLATPSTPRVRCHLLRLPVARAHDNVEAENIPHLNSSLLDLLLGRRLVDNHLHASPARAMGRHVEH